MDTVSTSDSEKCISLSTMLAQSKGPKRAHQILHGTKSHRRLKKREPTNRSKVILASPGVWFAHYELHKTKCPFIIKTKAFFEEYAQPYVIVPKHNPFSRALLHPHAKIVMYQLLKALACCHKHDVVHRAVNANSIVWKWNEKKTTPHIYLTNFALADSTGEANMDSGHHYDARELDVRHAGVLFLEMLLDTDVCGFAPNYVLPRQDLVQYCQMIDSKDQLIVTDLLERLLGDPTKCISAKQALKHRYFRM